MGCRGYFPALRFQLLSSYRMPRCSHAEAGCFGSFTVTGLWLWYKQHSSSGLVPFVMFEVKVVKFPRKLGNFNKTRGLSLWSRAVRHLDFLNHWTRTYWSIWEFSSRLPSAFTMQQFFLAGAGSSIPNVEAFLTWTLRPMLWAAW